MFLLFNFRKKKVRADFVEAEDYFLDVNKTCNLHFVAEWNGCQQPISTATESSQPILHGKIPIFNNSMLSSDDCMMLSQSLFPGEDVDTIGSRLQTALELWEGSKQADWGQRQGRVHHLVFKIRARYWKRNKNDQLFQALIFTSTKEACLAACLNEVSVESSLNST